MSDLKFFNGLGQGKYKNQILNIAANSTVQAAKIASFVCYDDLNVIRTNEIRHFFKEYWCDNMIEIKKTIKEPCCYFNKQDEEQKPTKIEIPKNL